MAVSRGKSEDREAGLWRREQMNKPKRHTYLAVLGLLVLGQVGCAITLRPSEEIRANLGTIGVASAQFTPQVNHDTPRGPAAGALRGVARSGGKYPALLLAPIQAIAGAVTAPSAEEVEKAEVALERAFADLKIQDALRDRVFDLARTGTDAPVVLLRGRGPTTLDDKPGYRSEASEGIETVLEVRVLTIVLREALTSLNIGNPTLQLQVTAGARLVRTLDGAELFSRPFYQRGGTDELPGWLVRAMDGQPKLFSRPFFHYGGTDKLAGWAEKDAEQLRDALSLAAAELAKEIVETLLRGPSEPAP
jgi:hypothetical protein